MAPTILMSRDVTWRDVAWPLKTASTVHESKIQWKVTWTQRGESSRTRVSVLPPRLARIKFCKTSYCKMMSFFLFLSLWSGKLGAFHYFYKQKLLSCAQKAFGEYSFGALYRKHQTHSFSRSRYDSFFILYIINGSHICTNWQQKEKKKEEKKKRNENNKTILLTKEAASSEQTGALEEQRYEQRLE